MFPDRRSAAPNSSPQSPRTGVTRAVFYDLRIPSRHVVFLIDASESMDRWGKYRGAIDELVRLLEDQVQDRARFSIVIFNDEIREWPADRGAKPELRTIDQGTGEDVRGLMTHVVHPQGRTNLIDALRKACAYEDADAVVVLSDGLPTAGQPKSESDILAELARLNRYARQQMHTVLMRGGRVFPRCDTTADPPKCGVLFVDGKFPSLTEEEKAQRKAALTYAKTWSAGAFLSSLAEAHEGQFSLAYGVDTKYGCGL